MNVIRKRCLAILLTILFCTVLLASCTDANGTTNTNTHTPSGEDALPESTLAQSVSLSESNSESLPSSPLPSEPSEPSAPSASHPSVSPSEDTSKECIHEEVKDEAVEARCDRLGLTEGSHCKKCGKVFIAQQEIPMTEHQWAEATCQSPKTCTVCKKHEGKAKGHSFGDWTVLKEATIKEEGKKERICSECNHKEEELIPKLEHTHSFSSEWTHDESEHWKDCSCGESDERSAHSFGAWQTVTDASCTQSGSAEQKCTACGYTEQKTIPKKGHSWQDATCTLPKTCSNCHQTEGNALGHSYENGVCSRCKLMRTSEGLSYRKEGAGYVVTGIGSCTDSYLVIPAEHKGLPVIGIGDEAFVYHYEDITGVVIPDSVTYIGSYAFACCQKLHTVVIGKGVKTIGDYAFNCTYALENLTWGSNIQTIGSWAFEGARFTEIVLPDSVETVGSYAFYDCRMMTSFTFGSKTRTVGEGIFTFCKSLENAHFSDLITTIERDMFRGCSKLTSIEIGKGVTSIGFCAFAECTALTDLKFHNSLKTIQDGAFQECIALKRIVLPDSLKTLGEAVFQSCINLESITLGKGLETIGQKAFSRCVALKKIDLPSSVKTLCAAAFEGCTSLESIVLPNSITTLQGTIFSGCTSLKSVTLPNGLKELPTHIFSDCTGLCDVAIPDGVEVIHEYAFYNCDSLASILIPINVKKIYSFAFSGSDGLQYIFCAASALPKEWDEFWLNQCTAEVCFKDCWTVQNGVPAPNHSWKEATCQAAKSCATCGLTEGQALDHNYENEICTLCGFCAQWEKMTYELRDGAYVIVGIGECTATELVIPAYHKGLPVRGVTLDALARCTMETVLISDGVTVLEQGAFFACKNLKTVVISDSVSTVGFNVFALCASLTDIYCEAASKPAGWHNNWNAHSSANVHWGDSWHYVDGVPTLK